LLQKFFQVGVLSAMLRRAFLLLACSLFAILFAGLPKNSMATNFNDPLVDASDIGDVGLVQKLLKNGHLPDSKGDFGTTALMRAAFRGNTEIIQILVESGAFVNAADVGGETALHLAAKNGHQEAVKSLLYYGAYIDVPDKEQWTPLMRATLARQPEIVKDLIDKGADVTAVNSLNESVLVHAAIAGVPDIAALILGSPKANKISKEQGQKAASLAKRQRHDKVDKVISAFADNQSNLNETKLVQNNQPNDPPQENSAMRTAPEYKISLPEKRVDPVIEYKKPAEIIKSAQPVIPNIIADAKKSAAPVYSQAPEPAKPQEKPRNIESAMQQIHEKHEEPVNLFGVEKPRVQQPLESLSEPLKQPEKISNNLNPKIEYGKTELANLPESAVTGKFFVQLGVFNDKDAAQNMWDKAIAKNPDVLGKLSQSLVEGNASGSKNDTEYRLRAGIIENKNDAANKCKVLRQRNSECYVIEEATPLINLADAKPVAPGSKNATELSNEDVRRDSARNQLKSVNKQEISGSNYPKLSDGVAKNIAPPIDIKPEPELMLPNNATEPDNQMAVDGMPWLVDSGSGQSHNAQPLLSNSKPANIAKNDPGSQQADDKINNESALSGLDEMGRKPYAVAENSVQNDSFIKHKDEIRNEIEERTRAEYFNKQGIIPPKRSKKDYDDFYKQIKRAPNNTSISEAVMVPDETYFAGSEPGQNVLENSKNWLNIYNLPDESFANDYGIRMFKSDESLGDVQLIINRADNAATVTMRVGPIDVGKSAALCSNVRAGGFGCSVIGDAGEGARGVAIKRTNLPKAESREENPFDALADDKADAAGLWINLGTFPSNSEAEYYWAFVKETNGDLLKNLQPKMLQNKDRNEKSVKLMVGPFKAKQRASQLCNIMRYRNVACLVTD